MTFYYNKKIKFPIIIKQVSQYDTVKLIVRRSNITNKIIIGVVSSPITINIKTCSPYIYGLFCEKIFDYIKYCNYCNKNKFNLNRLDCHECCYCYNVLQTNKHRKYRFGSILLNFPIIINNELIKKNVYDSLIECISYLIYENSEFNIKDSKFLIKIFFNQISKLVIINNNIVFESCSYGEKEKINYSSTIKNILILLFPILPTSYRNLTKKSTNKKNINKYYSNIIEINNNLSCKKKYNLSSLNSIIKLYSKTEQLTSTNKTFKINKKILLNLPKKKGILRTLFLGCRSDYSSRVIIIPGSDININNIGVPLNVAKYILSGYTSNNKKNIITTDNFKIQLNNIIKYNYTITNRPPTLHKMNIQSFSPILVENKAIKLCPLSCVGYNADFDGDQMSLFAPYFNSSNIESKTKLRSISNITSPTTQKQITYPTQGIFIGYTNISILYEFYFYKNVINNFNINLTDVLEYYINFNNSISSENKIFLKVKNKFELTTINRSVIKFNNVLFNL